MKKALRKVSGAIFQTRAPHTVEINTPSSNTIIILIDPSICIDTLISFVNNIALRYLSMSTIRYFLIRIKQHNILYFGKKHNYCNITLPTRCLIGSNLLNIPLPLPSVKAGEQRNTRFHSCENIRSTWLPFALRHTSVASRGSVPSFSGFVTKTTFPEITLYVLVLRLT